MEVPIFQIDAFTDHLFGGNPAAVCPLEYWLEPTLMQAIAAENNLSETAFFVKNDDGFDLRWFTPQSEVELCGHATLAAAHVLFNIHNYPGKKIDFFTKSGNLSVTNEGDTLSLDFPSRPATPTALFPQVTAALNKNPLQLLARKSIFMAVFSEEEDVLQIIPDWQKIKDLNCELLIITAKGKQSDFVSRVFAPSIGINEDPVTGAAHCTLVPYWSQVLGRSTLKAIQLSERRGILYCQSLKDRVKISGRAVTYLSGNITIQAD